MDVEAVTERNIHISMDLVAAPPAVTPGQVVGEGRYRVGERIGGGGMADVYVGRDQVLLRDVALKVLKPGMASADMFARMLQEARAAAAIDHPHLLRVTDVGRVGASMYLVTDLLRGASLGELLRILPDERMAWPHAIRLLLPALEALQRAHERGIIHRDIKPDNLFVHRGEDGERLVVLDLGIAKVAPALRTKDGPAPTETGRLIGTPAYMAPEQASGLTLTHSVDIYAAAVTLYRMIAGRLPFVAGPRDSPCMLMTRHIFEVPPPLAELVPAIPAALDRVVMRALAKAPGERPASMSSFGAALRCCLPPPETTARPVPAFERSGRFHRVTRVSSGAVVLGTMLGLSAPALPSASDAAADVEGVDGEVMRAAAALERWLAWPGAAPARGDVAGSTSRSVDVEAAVDGDAASGSTGDVVAAERPGDGVAGTRPGEVAIGERPVDVAAERRAAARRRVAVERVLAGAAAAVSGCLRAHGGVARRSIDVVLDVRADGRVRRVDTRDRDSSLLTDCAADALRGLRFPAGPARSIARRFVRGEGAP